MQTLDTIKGLHSFRKYQKKISRIPLILYLNGRERFLCLYLFSSKHEGKLGEFKKVLQTLDTIKSLHSFRKYPKKLLPIHVTCLFSVTNLSKI